MPNRSHGPGGKKPGRRRLSTSPPRPGLQGDDHPLRSTSPRRLLSCSPPGPGLQGDDRSPGTRGPRHHQAAIPLRRPAAAEDSRATALPDRSPAATPSPPPTLVKQRPPGTRKPPALVWRRARRQYPPHRSCVPGVVQVAAKVLDLRDHRLGRKRWRWSCAARRRSVHCIRMPRPHAR